MFKIVNFGAEHHSPTVLCLGRFESLHRGHKRIIEEAVEMAKPLGATVMLMTYDLDNLRFRGVILTFEERVALAERFGADSVLRIDFTDKFKAIGADEFLSVLKTKIDLKGIVCGFDFRFGYCRQGDTNTLRAFCLENSLGFRVVEQVSDGGEKVASSAVKRLLSQGEIKRANSMLGYRFFISGEVICGRRVGRTLGFPTANVRIPAEKNIIPAGVYLTTAVIDGREYKGITNCGTAPTFDCGDVLMETYLDGFSGDLYGQTLKVEFVDYIRGIKRFSSADELKKQLTEDLKRLL